jgi:flagellar biosynthetic protein FlhB
MVDETSQEERTEAATPRRITRAQEEGNVPVSREIPVLAGLVAATLVLASAGPEIARSFAIRLSAFLSQAHSQPMAGGGGVRLAIWAFLGGAGPFIAAALLAGVLAVLLQTGFLIHPGALKPQLRRVSPAAGLRRLLSPESAVDAVKSTGKIAALGLVTWRVLASDLSDLRAAPHWETGLLLASASRAALHVLAAAILVQGGIALADLLWVRFRYARRLRMSRQELREEQKESEGDPKIKARIRQIRHQRARRRMLAAVPKGTVVVTNPTHYAAALSYDRARNAAPRLVAKGMDELAARIREVAAAHRVPIVANPPLARALQKVELDTEIPAEHFQAVAEIIAYVWRLGSQAARR